MKEVKLTQGYVALVDDEDFDRVSTAGPWHAVVYPRSVYAKHTTAHIDGKQKPITMHSFILGVTDGRIEIDHEDHNGLNNQRINLRVATKHENQRNRRKSHNNTSGYKGVCWVKARHNWEAMIRVNGKSVWLGSFASAEDAARAYDSAALKYFGEFAFTNMMAQKEKGLLCQT